MSGRVGRRARHTYLYPELEASVEEPEVLTEWHKHHAVPEAASSIDGLGDILVTHVGEVVLRDGVARVRW